MTQEKEGMQSPFAALSYQEQQDRWLEWRSRQLAYQPVEREREKQAERIQKEAAAPAYPQLREPPPLRTPVFNAPAPTRHGELDKLKKRHAQASRQAGVYQKPPVSGISFQTRQSPDPSDG